MTHLGDAGERWPLSDALDVQSQHSADFFGTEACRRGVVGTAWAKTTKV